jgi:hypothetical protein
MKVRGRRHAALTVTMKNDNVRAACRRPRSPHAIAPVIPIKLLMVFDKLMPLFFTRAALKSNFRKRLFKVCDYIVNVFRTD